MENSHQECCMKIKTAKIFTSKGNLNFKFRSHNRFPYIEEGYP